MKTRNDQIITRAKAAGSTSTTLKGATKFCIKNRLTALKSAPQQPLARINLDDVEVGASVQLDSTLRYGFQLRPLTNAEARDLAASEIGTCGQRSNYSTGVARVYGKSAQVRWEKIHYKGKYKGYSGSYLHQDYQSCLAVSMSGRSVMVITSCVLRRRLVAPAGTQFVVDQNGVLVRRISDGMDFHPSDWMSKTFATDVRAAMAENYKRRASAKKAERQSARDKVEAERIHQIEKREIGSVRVTLDDSRRAGNCVEGSLAYAERWLGISREEILNGSYLFSVSASRLMTVNGHDGVKRAVQSAWLRETTPAI